MNPERENKNYYEILEIPVDATQEEVYQAYLKGKNNYTADSLALYSLLSEEECKQTLEFIEEAYTILSEPLKRREYDRVRGFKVEEPIKENIFSNMKFSPAGTSSPSHLENRNTQATPKTPDFTLKSNDTYVSPLSARQLFTLNYEVNNEFEREIEQTVQFTGAFLRKIREYKKVPIERLAEMTKVSKTNILNIENDNYKGLPASVYARGFIFLYAKHLKLNAELVAASYMNHLKTLQNEQNA